MEQTKVERIKTTIPVEVGDKVTFTQDGTEVSGTVQNIVGSGEVEIADCEWDTFTIAEPLHGDFVFQNGSEWVMKITEEGILFNRDAHPEWTPDEFAMEVIQLLENMFEVKFTRR